MNSRKGLKISPFFPFFPPGRSGHREQPKSWRTGLYGDGKTALAVAGRFLVRDPMADRSGGGISIRCLQSGAVVHA